MIRVATLEDAEQIAQVHVQSWHETYTGIIKQEILDGRSVEDCKQLWQKLIVDQQHRITVYEKDGVVSGFLDGYLNPEQMIAEIRAFYLLKIIHGQGIGRAMFEQFYLSLKPEQHSTLRLGVLNKNPSRFFYEKMGGTAIGEESIPEYGKNIVEIFYQWEIQKIV